MVRFKLRLSQDNNSHEVILDGAAGGIWRDVATFFGKFSSSEGNIPPERRLWSYALAKWELTLMDSGGQGVGQGGGGLSYGELASLSPSATLSRAIMTSRGVEPIDRSGTGVGEVMIPSEISVRFHRGRMTWELLAFQKNGSNAWHSP